MVDDPKNLLYYGDNLDVLRRHVKDESVDLVYLDPPFNSKQDYNAFFREASETPAAAQIKAFEDMWHWDLAAADAYRQVVEAGGRLSDAMKALRAFLGESDMLAYLCMMAPRLWEMRRVMKSTATIYLHCDPTASHYLKALMDAVFKPEHFLNEIVWKRTNARSTEARWPRLHDVILAYSKTADFKFTSIQVPADVEKTPHTLITGKDGNKYQTYELTGAGLTREGESGKPWRGFSPSEMGRHWANVHSQMDEWDAAGLIHWPKEGGFPRRRAAEPFVPDARMITVGDVWTDVDRINQSAKERLGYPTQKPEALLERIVQASSNPGDVVLDPFCGCGTAIAVALRLDRRWIGIDITHLAIGLIKHRLQNAFGEKVKETYKVVGEPVTLEDAKVLAESDKYQFQFWALGLVGARPAEERKGKDRGIDGKLTFFDKGNQEHLTIFSVKGGQTGPGDVRDLRGVIDREKAAIGVLITWQAPTAEMKKEAASADFFKSMWGDFPRLQILTIEDLLAGRTVAGPKFEIAGSTFRRAPRAAGTKSKSRDLFRKEDTGGE